MDLFDTGAVATDFLTVTVDLTGACAEEMLGTTRVGTVDDLR